MWGEKAHYPGPHLWKCLVYMWSFPFTCSNLSLQVKVFNKTCEIVIFNMSEMSFACQMSSWRVALVSFHMLEILCENSQIASELCGNVEKQISPDLKCGLEYHMRGKQITCANVSFAHVICFPHMWNKANHMNAYNPPDSVLPRVFCTWFVGDKSQSLIKKTFQFPWEIVIFFSLACSKKSFACGQVHSEGGPRLRSVAGECEWSRWKWARANVLGDPVEALGGVQKAGCGWVSSPEFQHSISEEALMSCNEAGESTVLSLIASGCPLVWLF